MNNEESLSLYRRLERMRQIEASLPPKLAQKEEAVSLIRKWNSLYASLDFFSGEEIQEYLENFLDSSEDDPTEDLESMFCHLEAKIRSLSPSFSSSAHSKIKSILAALNGYKEKIYDQLGNQKDRLAKMRYTVKDEEKDKIFSPEDLIDFHQTMVDSYQTVKKTDLVGLTKGENNEFDKLGANIRTLLEDDCAPSAFNCLWSDFLRELDSCLKPRGPPPYTNI